MWIDKKEQTFSYHVADQPDLVNFDGDKVLLCEKKETGKSLANYIHQYKVAGSYLDRREAITACSSMQDSANAVSLLKTALKDRYYELRILAVQSADYKNENVKQALETTIFDLAKGDVEPTVRAEALMALSLYDKPIYKDLIQRSVNDSSYTAAGAALLSLNQLDKPAAYAAAKKLSQTKAKDKLAEAISNTFAENNKEEDLDYVLNWYNGLPFGQAKLDNANVIAYYAIQLNGTASVKKATDALVTFRDEIPEAYQKDIFPFVNNVLLKTIATQKTAAKNLAADPAAIQEQIDYVNSQIK